MNCNTVNAAGTTVGVADASRSPSMVALAIPTDVPQLAVIGEAAGYGAICEKTDAIDGTTTDVTWVQFDECIRCGPAGVRLLRWFARRLHVLQAHPGDAIRAMRAWAREQVEASDLGDSDARVVRVCASLLCDLAEQGWRLRVDAPGVFVAPPPNGHSPLAEKARVRAAHLIERDNQLAQPAVHRFVRDMERRRQTQDGWKSIFSLMRDGRTLAEQLRAAAALPEQAARDAAIRACVDPYVQVVEPGAIDHATGLKLMDVWRYFRHTWTTTYNSTPGRKLFVLIRDRAAPDNPVIGIGALGSAIVQMSERDRWIGWNAEAFLGALRQRPTVQWARWVHDSLESLIAGVYRRDLVSDGIVTKQELRKPTIEAVQRLREEAKRARARHRLFAQHKQHKTAARSAPGTSSSTSSSGLSRSPAGDAHWRQQAQTYLFRAKRSAALADLLEVRLRLVLSGFSAPTRAGLEGALACTPGCRAIQTVLRHVRAVHVGVDMLDITVCGAVAPYNTLLGGKLVALLMTSPEVVQAYRKRYGAACSVIASSMAARAIRRPPNLVLLGTTSLYGIASSQYNRLHVPADAVGASEALTFERLGRTAGFGSYHFSRETMQQLEAVAAQGRRGREVNSIFGEGVNPKLRKVRGALDALGLPSDSLLQHGSPRLIYAVPLATNFRDILLGRAKRPKYILSQTPREQGAVSLSKYWVDRWLFPRIRRPEVLETVTAHTLAFPVTHGARVPLPAGDDESASAMD